MSNTYQSYRCDWTAKWHYDIRNSPRRTHYETLNVYEALILRITNSNKRVPSDSLLRCKTQRQINFCAQATSTYIDDAVANHHGSSQPLTIPPHRRFTLMLSTVKLPPHKPTPPPHTTTSTNPTPHHNPLPHTPNTHTPPTHQNKKTHPPNTPIPHTTKPNQPTPPTPTPHTHVQGGPMRLTVPNASIFSSTPPDKPVPDKLTNYTLSGQHYDVLRRSLLMRLGSYLSSKTKIHVAPYHLQSYVTCNPHLVHLIQLGTSRFRKLGLR